MMYNPQLETFLCVVDSGSFSKAAERLYITPPAVIKQINALESNLEQNIDVIAGIFDDTMLHLRKCSGMKISEEKFCCAVSLHHRLAGKEILTVEDLYGEYLCCFVRKYGQRVLLAYGGGSIKENGIYDEVTAILMKAEAKIIEFSGIMANPTYEKVLEGAKLARERQADWILGVRGGSVMDCCKAVSMAAVSKKDIWENYWAKSGIIDFEPLPTGVIVTIAGTGSECNGGAVITNESLKLKTGRDYPARSNLLWASTMGEKRIIRLGKKCDFQCHQMEHQLGAYTNCNHGYGLAVLHPAYYRHIYKYGLGKFVRFAENVWQIPRDRKNDEELARAGINALAEFISEIGLPRTLRELGMGSSEKLKEIADSCNLSPGSYKKMSHEKILEIFLECYK